MFWLFLFYQVRQETFEIGNLLTFTPVIHKFFLFNERDTFIKIKKIRNKCGCIRICAFSDSIPPKDSIPVILYFNPSGYQGVVSKGGYVMFEDNSVIQLGIKVKLEASSIPIKLSPVPITIRKGKKRRMNVDLIFDNDSSTEYWIIFVYYDRDTGIEKDTLFLPSMTKKNVKVSFYNLDKRDFYETIIIEIYGRSKKRLERWGVPVILSPSNNE